MEYPIGSSYTIELSRGIFYGLLDLFSLFLLFSIFVAVHNACREIVEKNGDESSAKALYSISSLTIIGIISFLAAGLDWTWNFDLSPIATFWRNLTRVLVFLGGAAIIGIWSKVSLLFHNEDKSK